MTVNLLLPYKGNSLLFHFREGTDDSFASVGWWVDDVVADVTAPTAATLTSFAGHGSPAGIVVPWRTGEEATLAGFNVYRLRARAATRMNARLIAAKASGRATGASYRLLDVRPGLA